MTANQDSSASLRSAFILWIALFLCLLWPAAFNGGAFFFPDTPTYFRGADAAVYKLTGQQTQWTNEFFKSYPHASGVVNSKIDLGTGHTSAEIDKVVLSGRSIYFGFLIYLIDLISGPWLIVLTQAAITAIALVMIVRRVIGSELNSATIITVSGLLAVSSAGFFTALVMPDWLAPLSIAGAALVLSGLDEMGTRERIFWFLLISLALVSHSANSLILIGVITVYALTVGVRRQWQKFVYLGAALIIAFAGEAAFNFAVKQETGFPPVRPPFLSARVIDDGPGYDYLKKTCPFDDALEVCRYLDRLPVHSDTFLWATGNNGVFSASPSAVKRSLSAQDSELFVKSFLYAPLEFTQAVAENVVEQASRNGLEEFNGVITDSRKLTSEMNAHAAGTRAIAGTMPVAFLSPLFLLVFALSLTAIGAFAALRPKSGGISNPSIQFVALVIAGIAVNIFVCGAFSTPHDRYFARVMWLAPFAASLLAALVINASPRVLGHTRANNPN